MTGKRTVLARIIVLYILLGAVIVTGVVVSFNKASFTEGLNVGAQMAANSTSGEQRKVMIPEVLFDQSVIPQQSVETTDSLSVTRVVYQVSKLNMHINNDRVDSEYIVSLCLTLLAMLLYAAIFVVIFLVISSILKSLRTGAGFNKRNIVMTRLIAVFLIAATLLTSFASWIDGHVAAKYTAAAGYTIDTAFSPDFVQLITAVLVFVMAEVFAIGVDLTEEQKLTI